MQVKRHDETMEVSPQQAAKLLRHGWNPVTETAGEDIIRLKPPVKNKATAKTALEEATYLKGDE
jgi:hypothetical protein